MEVKYLEGFKGRLVWVLGAASARRQQRGTMKSNGSFEKLQLFARLVSKDDFQNAALGGNGCSHHFQGLCWAVAAGNALFSSPTTHRPSRKAGGKNAVLLKIKLGCVATYCKIFFYRERKKKLL
jgi:hypothetical protein